MFSSIDELAAKLKSVRYLVAEEMLPAIYLAMKLGRPLLIEGPPGSGKTAIALIMKREPGYFPSETDGLSERAAAVASLFGDLQSVAAAGKTAVLKRKYSGRKTLSELTSRLQTYGIEWTQDKQRPVDLGDPNSLA